jgi:hypothetical protein
MRMVLISSQCKFIIIINIIVIDTLPFVIELMMDERRQ